MTLTVGSLFAGIGGFDLGFERAGLKTVWQVEINPVHRLVLAERFPSARQYEDVRTCGSANLAPVDIICGGFPCQDISAMGNTRTGGQQGLSGERSGLFWEALRIIKEVRPQWVVLENVPNLISINDSQDFETVITSLAQCGYVGYGRVLNAQYFGVPQNRRRLFLVAGLGRHPHIDFLADALPVEALPVTLSAEQLARHEMAAPFNTLTAANARGRINFGSEVLVAEEDGWGAMVERERVSSLHGISKGLDDANYYQRYAAGNAIIPAIATWCAEIIKRS